jgi:hypothetical protein
MEPGPGFAWWPLGHGAKGKPAGWRSAEPGGALLEGMILGVRRFPGASALTLRA